MQSATVALSAAFPIYCILEVAKWTFVCKEQLALALLRVDSCRLIYEVVYRDPYTATRVGEAANPGPANLGADSLTFEDQLALEEQYAIDFADPLLPDLDEYLCRTDEEAGESVHPRPPREVAPEAVPPQRTPTLKTPAEEGET